MTEQLSEHFSFDELTITNKGEAFQIANRVVARAYLPALKALAELLEIIRGDKPLIVNSAFRCADLNKATAGSSPTSQHPRGQAADIHRPGQDVEALFQEVLARVKSEKIPFGQLIDESANRDYGVARWVHISLGKDFWIQERCGEVMRKMDGPDGKPIYTQLEKVEQ